MNKSETIEQSRIVCRTRRLSMHTEDCYAHWIGRFCEHAKTCKDAPREERIRLFLEKLAPRSAASTQNQALNAIVFLYRDVLKQELKDVKSLRAKRPAMVRYAPSKPEVLALIEEAKDTHGYPTRLVVKLLYGCGLRVTEPLNLRVKDVDTAHSGKDRVVSVPCSLMSEIVAQMKRAKQTWEDDVKAGLPAEVPGQLARKYPNAPFAWQWSWVFPSKTACRHPRTGEMVRYRMHEANVQRCVKAAATKLGLDSAVTPHCLRHAYATHVLDAGTNIRDLQSALGHASLDTTMGYVHAESARVVSPLA